MQAYRKDTKIREAEIREYLAKEMRQAEAKRQREAAAEKKVKFQEEAKEREENPERFVDPVLERLVTYSESHFRGGVNIMANKLKALLRALSGKLGVAFVSEVNRLRARIEQFAASATVEEAVNRIVDGLVEEIISESGAS